MTLRDRRHGPDQCHYYGVFRSAVTRLAVAGVFHFKGAHGDTGAGRLEELSQLSALQNNDEKEGRTH